MNRFKVDEVVQENEGVTKPVGDGLDRRGRRRLLLGVAMLCKARLCSRSVAQALIRWLLIVRDLSWHESMAEGPEASRDLHIPRA